MRLFLFFLLAFSPSLFATEKDFFAYAPSRKTSKILVIKTSFKDGQATMTRLDDIALSSPDATIAKHPKQPLLYSVPPMGEDIKGNVIHLNADGSYKSHEVANYKHGYSYMSLDRNAKYLLGAQYRGGQVDVYALENGAKSLKAVTSISEGRKTAHCIMTSVDNNFVYVPYVKNNNALYQYRFDASTGKLTALNPLNAQPPEGAGPRHMATHPKLPIVYFTNEQHLGVSVYQQVQNGQLKHIQLCDSIQAKDKKPKMSSSDIMITPDARFLYTGIRAAAHDFCQVARYKILDSGKVTFMGFTEVDAVPWGMTFSPNGEYLLVTAAVGNTLSLFKILDQGDLKLVDKIEIDNHITDIVTAN